MPCCFAMGSRFPETGIIDNCELSCGGWELNHLSSPLIDFKKTRIPSKGKLKFGLKALFIVS